MKEKFLNKMFRYNKNGQSKEIEKKSKRNRKEIEKKSKRNRKEIEKKSKRNRKRILDGGIDIDVVIKDFLGGRYVIKIDNENTIKELIEKCRENSPIDETKFKYILRLDGKILSDSSKISDCGIEMESTLELTTKKLPSPFCGLYVFTDYDNHNHNTLNKILILNDDNTGHCLVSPQTGKDLKTYKHLDVVWTYNETNNILKVLIYGYHIYFINTTNYFGYYNVKKWITYSSLDSIEQFRKIYEKVHPRFSRPREGFVFRELSTKESQIEFLNNFNPLIHSVKCHSVFGTDGDNLLLRISFDGREFKQILETLISSSNIFFLEHIIKVFRYMDKGVFAEVFKFDNPENMKKSIEIFFSGPGTDLFSRLPDDTCRKQLMDIIESIPRMDIFDK